jgi:MoaA/NifB/PqqE/SkfB family radical SAM enzyme
MPELSPKRKAQIIARTTKNVMTGRPVTVSYEVTYNCNADCKHCDLGRHNHIKEPRLGPEEFARWVTDLRPAVGQISGGEPLLRKDIVDIVRAMRERDPIPVFVLTTNVQILNEEKFNKLREAGVDKFSFSLDYPDERHNEFRDLKNNFGHIRDLIANVNSNGRSDVVLACVVQSDNFRDLPAMAELARDWGVAVNFSTYNCLRTGNEDYLFKAPGLLDDLRKVVDKVVTMQRDGYPVVTSEWTLRQMIKFFETASRPNCKAGKRFMIVNPWAKLTPCGMFRDQYDSREDLIERFSSKNDCGRCFTAIRANSEKSPYRLLVDAARAVRR